MIEVKADLWTYPADYRVITTNGYVKKTGECVMGRGCAYEASKKHPDLPLLLGNLITHYGNKVHLLPDGIISFPVKHNWYEKADPKLISRSMAQLDYLIDLYEWKVIMPRAGCGNGGLKWKDVKSTFIFYPDNLIICHK